MRLALSLFSASIAFLFGGHSGKATTPDPNRPVELVDTFYSYTSISDVQQALSKRGLSWSIIENSHLSPEDRRPPVSTVRLSVADFHYLGHVGELQFEFFNDRLMSTSFFPNDPVGFARAVQERLKISLAAEVVIPPFTRVFRHRDYKDRVYFAWEDTRLVKEMTFWIEKYS